MFISFREILSYFNEKNHGNKKILIDSMELST